MEKKKCSGCKEQKVLDSFYKNKNMKDGHSNYCIDCTKENSKKYFTRRKHKVSNSENDDIIKMVLLSNMNNIDTSDNKFVKIVIIEKLCYALIDEINKLKEMISQSTEVEQGQ